MEKLAMYGGTFNPIHNGHLHLAQEFRRRLQLDRILLIPTRVPPHKTVPDLASAEDRFRMCQLAAEPHGFEVSDLELRREGPSYTADTLRELHALYPGAQLYLITGADMFLTLEQWHDSTALLRLARLCAAPRDESGRHELLKYAEHLRRLGAQTCVENIPLLPVSSTLVRRRVRAGESVAKLVPTAVEQYIIRHHLYGGIVNGSEAI